MESMTCEGGRDSSPTIACLCLLAMRSGPPLDGSCSYRNDDAIASLFMEPLALIDSIVFFPTTPALECEQDSRKRPASAVNGEGNVAMDTVDGPVGDDIGSNNGTRMNPVQPPRHTSATHLSHNVHPSAVGGVLVPYKRRRIAYCLLLNARPEVLRYIRSFLTLQDALTLKSTCRKLHNDGYDSYRYSTLLTCNVLAKNGFTGPTCTWQFCQEQEHVLMRRQNDAKVRALLLNDFIPPFHLRRFIWTLLKTTTTDNASVVSILLRDDRVDVDPFMLDQALRRNFVKIASVLEQDDRVKDDIQMCATCNSNIGCFECFRALDCCVLPEPPQGRIWCSWDDLPPSFRKPKKYCRSCVLRDNTFCKICSEYLCPECQRCHNHGSCETCHSILCLEDFFSKQPVLVCDECPRMKCRSCLYPGEGWLEVLDNGFPITLCPTCKHHFEPSQQGTVEILSS